MNQAITFLSDGDDTLRQLQWEMSPKATHILDWFHLTMKLTRAKFEELTSDLTDRTVQPFKNAISDAKLDVSQIPGYATLAAKKPIVADTP